MTQKHHSREPVFLISKFHLEGVPTWDSRLYSRVSRRRALGGMRKEINDAERREDSTGRTSCKNAQGRLRSG